MSVFKRRNLRACKCSWNASGFFLFRDPSSSCVRVVNNTSVPCNLHERMETRLPVYASASQANSRKWLIVFWGHTAVRINADLLLMRPFWTAIFMQENEFEFVISKNVRPFCWPQCVSIAWHSRDPLLLHPKTWHFSHVKTLWICISKRVSASKLPQLSWLPLSYASLIHHHSYQAYDIKWSRNYLWCILRDSQLYLSETLLYACIIYQNAHSPYGVDCHFHRRHTAVVRDDRFIERHSSFKVD